MTNYCRFSACLLSWCILSALCEVDIRRQYEDIVSEHGESLEQCDELRKLFISLQDKSDSPSKDTVNEIESLPYNRTVSDDVYNSFSDEIDAAIEACSTNKNRLSWKTWVVGSAVVLLISVTSMTGALLIPFMNAKMYHHVLSFLVALAVGSLSGSSVLHLIPHAFQMEGDEYLGKGAMVLAGIYLFFITERGLKCIMHWRKNRYKKMYPESNGVSHQQDLPPLCSVMGRNYHYDNNCCIEPSLMLKASSQHKPTSMSIDANNDGGGSPCSSVDVGMIADSDLNNHLTSSEENNGHIVYRASSPDGQHKIPNGEKQKNSGGCKHGHQVDTSRPIATVAWMVIFGDGIHNFIDGLAIGAAFVTSTVAGMSTSVAVICEELPHELGDFAILLNAGMTWKQALFYNFLSALSCFIGLAIGILLGELAEASGWIFGLAGGMFLYISLVDMMGETMNKMPEMTEAAKEEPEEEENDVTGTSQPSPKTVHSQKLSNNHHPEKGHPHSTEVTFKSKPQAQHAPSNKKSGNEHGHDDDRPPSVKMLVLQSAGMILGWFLMYIFAKYGDLISEIF
ncbi:metal cation symporter ZIP14-like isoform X3 [Convolutriloba macropyga]|uniref:metal cation symporter ZIP14-like isoform X3 n=1 Tax=Convolutriloba macropyga TaxID=536237 RepID=UPI003F527A8B